MAKLIVIVGLPGSGKTTYIRGLAHQGLGVCEHDYMANSYGNSARFTDSRHYQNLVCALREGKDSLIADIEYCDTWKRIELEQIITRDVQGVEIEWRFFSNEPEKCEANANRRRRANIDQEKQKIRELSRKYHIPYDANIIPVWAPEL